MSKTRNIADLLDASGDVKLSALDNVPDFVESGDNISVLTNDSGYITDYTVTESDVTTHQAALSITESQISDLAHTTSLPFSSITATPTTIVGYGITDAFDGAYSSLTATPTTLSGYGITDAATSTQGATADSALQDVVDDTTPQLGGDLDLNSNDITGTGNIDITGNAVYQTALNAQTGTTYTTVIGDASKLITLNNASAITVTIPPNSSVAYPVGTKIDFAQIGVGQVTFAGGSGVTVNSTPTLKTRARFSAVSCIKISTDGWILVGDLAES